jgi:hypothetical protein
MKIAKQKTALLPEGRLRKSLEFTDIMLYLLIGLLRYNLCHIWPGCDEKQKARLFTCSEKPGLTIFPNNIQVLERLALPCDMFDYNADFMKTGAQPVLIASAKHLTII